MNEVVIFLGPTLAANEANMLLPARYLPPVAQGDVVLVARDKPWAIGIVDGYFERVPAVWHKEILWAMSRGIHVFGASSMGALRAAELADFGMVGVGAIFEAYRTGELTDDDEVAIVHASSEFEYRASSVAMVDIRATLSKAERAGVIGAETARQLVVLGKRLSFPEREYARLLATARKESIDWRELERLASWLPGNAVHQKRADAELMLHRIAEQRVTPAAKSVHFTFEHTDAFERVLQRAAMTPTTEVREQSDAEDAGLLEELRLEPAAYEAARNLAFARTLAVELSERLGRVAHETMYRTVVEHFRRANHLLDPNCTLAWLRERRIEHAAFADRMREEVLVNELRRLLSEATERRLLDWIKLSPDYVRLQRRAREKRERLESQPATDLASAGIDPQALLDWFFQRLGLATPTARSMSAWLEQLDYKDPYAFLRTILREYLFVK